MKKNSKQTPTAETAPDGTKIRTSKQWLSDLRGGQGVSLEFFKRNGWLLATIIIIILSLMGLRYRTQTRMVEIEHLTEELKMAESEKLSAKKEYMTLIRQTKMNELVQQHRLPLIHQEQPPYEIVDD